MRRFLPLLLVAAVLPARAGLFDDDEARARIERMRAELRAETVALSQRVDQAAKNQLDFANQAEALKGDVARLRGQMEVLLNDVDAVQKRQRDFYVDLDGRLRKLEAAAVAAAKPPEPPKPDPMQETRDYEAALGSFKAAKYGDANAAFLAFIKNYPSSGLLPNAWYWAGSSHFQMKEYAKAAEAFAKVAATWPNDAKAPDALLAQGNAIAIVGDGKGRKAVLETLVAKYPQSTAAKMASRTLSPARLGMTAKEVREKTGWGTPKDINRTQVGKKIEEQWVYGEKSFLYFSNGKLTAIQD